jgi:hypothetical protein
MLGLVKAYARLFTERSDGVTDMPSELSKAVPHAHRRRDLAIGGSLLCAALIAGVFTCLPILTSSLATAKTPALPVTASRTISNAALKSDRLPGVHSAREDRGAGGVAIPTAPAKPEVSPKRRLPMGCESAFGALRVGDLAARCVTGLTPPTRLAAAGGEAVGM